MNAHPLACLCAVSGFLFAMPALAAEPRIEWRRNPNIGLESGLDPTFFDLLGGSLDWSFSNENPPERLTVVWDFQYTDDFIVALIENFKASAGPLHSAQELGFDGDTNFNSFFSVYFAMYPDVEYAFAWNTSEFEETSTFLQHTAPPTIRAFGPMGRCSENDVDTMQVIQQVVGSPNLGDGIMGVDLTGIITGNQLCLRSDYGGDALKVVGHAFIQLIATSGDVVTQGFYPDFGGSRAWAVSTFPGVYHDDTNHDWDHEICWLITNDQYEAAADAVFTMNPPQYKLLDVALGGSVNCTSWALGVAQAAGLPLPASTNKFVYDPEALDTTLSGLTGSLYMNCGKVRANSNSTGTTSYTARGAEPFDFSPVAGMLAMLDDPSDVAADLGVNVTDQMLATQIITAGGTINVQITGVAADDVAVIIDWGDGQVDVQAGQLSFAHTAPTAGGFQVRIGVFEDGSVQRLIAPMFVSSSGSGNLQIDVDVMDFPAVEIPNGPFIPPPAPALPDVNDCNTDCNANGVLDCTEAPAELLDCNDNGIYDECDIASGSSLDVNTDGVPDECQDVDTCPGDASGDNTVDITDLNLILGNFQQTGAPGIPGDLNGDGVVNITDLNQVLGNFQNSCL